jgi:phosphate transport system protein
MAEKLTYWEELLEGLTEKVLRLGGLVEEAIGRSVRSLVDRDSDLAMMVVASDREIDRLELEIDSACLEMLALHQPFARDLRFVTTAMKITTDLERIGDLSVNIGERAMELNEEPLLKPIIDLPLMARKAQEMVRGALDAFVRRDSGLAKSIIEMDDELDERMEQVFRVLLSFMLEDTATITRALRLSFVAKYFERIGDMATNICEQVVFMTEGEVVKHPDAQVDDGR